MAIEFKRENHITPTASVWVLAEKYSKPIKVITLFDTGLAFSFLDPNFLPKDKWKPCSQGFKTANGGNFGVQRKSVPIYIRLYPGHLIKATFYGFNFLGEEMLIGFDIIQHIGKIQWTKQGLKFRNYLVQWIRTPIVFHITQTMEEIKAQLIHFNCADNHNEFLKKCLKPLWKNSEFFVNLPFKKNEDINPTKASHKGMNPDHYALAQAELTQLQDKGLIEPTKPQWACEAFYVSLFSQLSVAQVFSKFDLKVGFWQLGISLKDRPKTAFCIPNHHYQGIVMPFGLKVAPSIFQKAMTRIFQPMLHHALVYIDDILLFSKDEETHGKLLNDFKKLITQYGIMLSEKMIIGVNTVDFLGMKICQGKYELQPHIATQLNTFPDN
ncbi:uncharacterized protein LOC131144998 [Malania oleifera]|uniref:uncharacterized protein LOC131144998 n=1 Tax=Malania oleifera TaxID=397392 RepID=UPI0025ADD617|nr:uncharacterized protein LOC131144998 [Malania oleifera]